MTNFSLSLAGAEEVATTETPTRDRRIRPETATCEWPFSHPPIIPTLSAVLGCVPVEWRNCSPRTWLRTWTRTCDPRLRLADGASGQLSRAVLWRTECAVATAVTAVHSSPPGNRSPPFVLRTGVLCKLQSGYWIGLPTQTEAERAFVRISLNNESY